MTPDNQLDQKAAGILEEIAALGPMRKGSLCKRVLKRKTAEGNTRTRGPYWYYTFKSKGKTLCRMINDSEVELYKKQIGEFREFQTLTRKYADLSQRMANRNAEKQSGSKKNSSA